MPWLLMGELCPVKVKGITSGCVACSAFGTIFILVKLFPMLTEVLGQHGTYFGFAIVCVIMAFFTQTFVPGLQAKIFKLGIICQIHFLILKQGELINSLNF